MSDESAGERIDSRLRDARERLEALEQGGRDASAHVQVEGASPALDGSEGRDHVLFVPSPAGYTLINRPGAPPSPGEPVEVPDRGEAFVVTKVADSPLPGDARPCVYLVAV